MFLENIEINMICLGEGNDFFDMATKTQATKEELDTLNFTKMNNFVLQRIQVINENTAHKNGGNFCKSLIW